MPDTTLPPPPPPPFGPDTPLARLLTPDLLRRLADALFGEAVHTERLAAFLGCDTRIVRRMLAGRAPIPLAVEEQLLALIPIREAAFSAQRTDLARRGGALAQLRRELDALATALDAPDEKH